MTTCMLAILVRTARAAAAAGAEDIVFPELFLSGYDRDDLPDLALIKDEVADVIQRIAAQEALRSRQPLDTG